MPNDPINLQDQIDKLKKELSSFTQAYYLNNFLTSQDFNKNSRFNTGLKVPHYDSLPSTCETGQVGEYTGKLYVCSAADTWTIVGTQS